MFMSFVLIIIQDNFCLFVSQLQSCAVCISITFLSLLGHCDTAVVSSVKTNLEERAVLAFLPRSGIHTAQVYFFWLSPLWSASFTAGLGWGHEKFKKKEVACDVLTVCHFQHHRHGGTAPAGRDVASLNVTIHLLWPQALDCRSVTLTLPLSPKHLLWVHICSCHDKPVLSHDCQIE